MYIYIYILKEYEQKEELLKNAHENGKLARLRYNGAHGH